MLSENFFWNRKMATGHDLQESLKQNEKIFAIQIFRPLLIRMVKAGELISSPKIKKILGVGKYF